MQYGPGERGKLPKYVPYTKPVYKATTTDVVLCVLVSVVTIALVVVLGALVVLPLI